MSTKDCFKKPTIKGTNRAYVRLFEYFRTPTEWQAFVGHYDVRPMSHGQQRYGDCAVRVFDRSTGGLAVLGLEIPNEITYHTFMGSSPRSFWNERFTSDTHQRHRTFEIPYNEPSSDELVAR